jgi:hypothetical protein
MTRAIRTPPSHQQFEDCIRACEECRRICLTMTQAGEHARLLQDCAQICGVSADFMTRSSPMHVHTCLACSEICDACAQECERHPDDAAMKRCARACRACAESCRKMAELPIA